jgi:MarR family transcriptional regulator, negative regulator of the multidrug operon emrRAB
VDAGDRLAQLLGTVGLAAADRIAAVAAAEAGHEGGAPAALVHLAAHPGGSVNALAAVLAISQPAAVRTVDRLVADGLLERRAGGDRRTRSLHLTPAGQAAAVRILARRREALRPLLDPLAEDDRAALTPLLERLVAALADDRPTALTVCRLCDRPACTMGGCPLDHTAVDA